MPASKRALSQQQAEWLRREVDVWRQHQPEIVLTPKGKAALEGLVIE